MRIYVTGGNGFIGFRFIKYALKQGHTVCASIRGKMDINIYGLSQVSRESKMTIAGCDIREYGDVLRSIASFDPDLVVHFAAESHVAKSIEDPLSHIQTNIIGTHNMLSVCRDLKIMYGHMSTCEVYGSSDVLINEEHPFHPNSPYAASKAGADALVQSYVATYGMPAVIFRPANNYGGKQHHEKMIPRFLHQAKTTGKITVHGTGEQTREWLYVEDCVSLMYETLMKAMEDRSSHIFNVSNDDEKSVLAIAEVIASATGADIEFIENRAGQVDRFALTNHKLAFFLKKPITMGGLPSRHRICDTSVLQHVKDLCLTDD